MLAITKLLLGFMREPMEVQKQIIINPGICQSVALSDSEKYVLSMLV